MGGLVFLIVRITALRVGHRANNVAFADRAGSSAGGKPRGTRMRVSKRHSDKQGVCSQLTCIPRGTRDHMASS